MDDIGKIKKQVAIYGGAVILVAEAVSLFIIGFDFSFTLFLLTGFIAGIINFNIIAFFLKKMLQSGNPGFSTISLVVRMLIYGAVFLIAVKQGLACGAGALIGFLAPKVPLYYFNAVKPDFNKDRKVSDEVKAMYEQDDLEEEEGRWGGKEE